MEDYRKLRKEIMDWAIENRKKHEAILKSIEAMTLQLKKLNESRKKENIVYNNPDSEPE